ncbi:hypothetical protein NC652_018435 [Populus alba x Populus x berolinensis]|nr:hypothetical protein NC652_018435 [Populus alba x Populus x berolinensis]
MFLPRQVNLDIYFKRNLFLKQLTSSQSSLAFTVLLNSVQPVLSGVAVGSGWQKYVAYINLGCYYAIGVPLGFLMGWFFDQGVMGIWAGMIFGGTSSSNTNTGRHYHSMRLGKGGRESKPACIEVVRSNLKTEVINFRRSSPSSSACFQGISMDRSRRRS